MKFSEFVPPMLLSERESPFDDGDYIFELKFDGIRAMLHASPREVKVYSRNGNEITQSFPELQCIKSIVSEKTIFDGEIVAFADGKPSFSKLQKRNLMKNSRKISVSSENEPVTFVVFDCIYEGKSLVNIPLIERKGFLEKYPDTDVFVKTKYIFKNGKRFFKNVAKLGLEGIVAKKSDSLYQVGIRTRDWIKIKNFRCESFLIGGYVVNKIRTSLLLGEYRGKDFFYVGKVSIERDNPLFKKLCSLRSVKVSPFCNHSEVDAHYVALEYSCEVSYIERTPGKNLRQPIFKREIKKGRSIG